MWLRHECGWSSQYLTKTRRRCAWCHHSFDSIPTSSILGHGIASLSLHITPVRHVGEAESHLDTYVFLNDPLVV
ncbi:hypothetical protein VTN49DRAFT_3623 [Thermomyces lanuginosus]|uniref:uncharacterized protein n=1 Tax=Thermomyces lanuginosus TaxID=5541 RepID=UPI0037442EB9